MVFSLQNQQDQKGQFLPCQLIKASLQMKSLFVQVCLKEKLLVFQHSSIMLIWVNHQQEEDLLKQIMQVILMPVSEPFRTLNWCQFRHSETSSREQKLLCRLFSQSLWVPYWVQWFAFSESRHLIRAFLQDQNLMLSELLREHLSRHWAAVSMLKDRSPFWSILDSAGVSFPAQIVSMIIDRSKRPLLLRVVLLP